MAAAIESTELKAGSAKDIAGKFLTFRLREESYGIKVLQVREIVRLTDITPVPQMPVHIKGVINLRGRVIPVVDLGLKLGLGEVQKDEHACIVVVQVAGKQGGVRSMGLIVDAVEEVVNISAADIEETPDFGVEVSTELILGIAKVKGAVKTILDIERAVD